MKFNWKKILGVAESFGENFLPGGSDISEAIKKVVAAKSGVDRETAILEAIIVGLNIAEEEFDAKFADEPEFQLGLLQANAGVLTMIKAVKAQA